GIDAYAVLSCHGQEKRSNVVSVHSSQGSKPEWNETHLFNISGRENELRIRIMDKDTLTADDFLGEVLIPLQPVFEEESIPNTTYNLIKDERYCGGVRVGLKFTHQRTREFA
ncbi:hypothetical protein M569_11295, partial [Genlisea aurea]